MANLRKYMHDVILYIKEDIAGFDAPFLSMPQNEVAAMVLEIAYETFENAGIPVNEVKGSKTSVFVGSFLHEYDTMLNRDVNLDQKCKAPGTATAMLANQLSWFYDLKGPNLALGTACSSGLYALHLACQSIRTGESEMSLVGGANLFYNPDLAMSLENMNFLSPDGVSYSFDKRANGSARGEGIGMLVVKSLTKAIEDGDTIRAVVRATGANQDGRTPGITQPSAEAQEAMIRDTYKSAGLNMDKTAFVEAHGTGTALGDPIEAQAIGNAFKTSRQTDAPIYVGAMKTNIGHLEATSGIASLPDIRLTTAKDIG